jgi:hypothetical protein
MSRASLMAGFEVTLYGRFWVTPEGEISKFLITYQDLEFQKQYN